MHTVRSRELERAPGLFIVRAETVKQPRLIEKSRPSAGRQKDGSRYAARESGEKTSRSGPLWKRAERLASIARVDALTVHIKFNETARNAAALNRPNGALYV